MKRRLIRLQITFLCLAICACIFTPSLFAAEQHNSDLAQVTNVLATYQKSINDSNFKVSAECLPPPMDQSNIANEDMIDAYRRFALAYEKKWGDELLPGVNLEPLKVHPLTYLTNYTFNNIQIQGDRATVDVEMTVNDQVKKSSQHLAKIDGKWYVTQKEDPPGYSEAEKRMITELTGLLRQQAESINDLINKINKGAISQEDCLENVRQNMVEFEKSRAALINR